MTESASSEEIRKKLFEYDDYRVFLADFFSAWKREEPRFSHRFFAKRAGFDAHNFLPMVIAGKRNLSADSIKKIASKIGLRGKAQSFFKNLVYLNQAETIAKKDLFFRKLKVTGGKTNFHRLNKNQFFFSEKWYYPVIRELMVLSDWNGDYSRLAKLVRPPITRSEAQEAAELLVTSGIVKRENKTFSLAQEFISAEKVPAYFKQKARRDVLLKGAEIIENIDNPADKYVACSTVTMSRNLYEKVRARFDEMRREVLSMVARDEGIDEVYEVVLQIFPVSNLKAERNDSKGDGDAA